MASAGADAAVVFQTGGASCCSPPQLALATQSTAGQQPRTHGRWMGGEQGGVEEPKRTRPGSSQKVCGGDSGGVVDGHLVDSVLHAGV